MTTALLQRIVLVEDDPSITRFVQMALDELPINLIACSSVADALKALETDGARLVITDLMLQGESGIGLVQRLAQEPACAHGARIAVFSAGLTPAMRSQLAGMGVWRMLGKPASIQELQDCVRDTLEFDHPRLAPITLSSVPENGPEEGHAIKTYFAGNTKLFFYYRARCRDQFPKDIEQGDAAIHAQDWGALRRLSHSLGTVLLTLGKLQESAIARHIESAATVQAAEECKRLWPQLKVRLATA